VILLALALLFPLPARSAEILRNEALAGFHAGASSPFGDFLAQARQNSLAQAVAAARESGDGKAALAPALDFARNALAEAFGVFDPVLPVNVFGGINLNSLNLEVTGVEFAPVFPAAEEGALLAAIRFTGYGTLPGYRMDTPGGSLTMGDISVEELRGTVQIRQ
jgi:hypothetical protein